MLLALCYTISMVVSGAGEAAAKVAQPWECFDEDTFIPLCTNESGHASCHYGNIGSALRWQQNALKEGLANYAEGDSHKLLRVACYLAAYMVMRQPPMPIAQFHGSRRAHHADVTRHAQHVTVALVSVGPSCVMELHYGVAFRPVTRSACMMYPPCGSLSHHRIISLGSFMAADGMSGCMTATWNWPTNTKIKLIVG